MADTGKPVGQLHRAGAAPSRPRAVRRGVVSLCLVQFVDVLGVTVIVTALPAMLADLRAPAGAASLISAGYAMFFGGLLMLGARMGDRIGHRRIILTGLAIFAVAAAVGATAALSTGIPESGSPVPVIAWGTAALISLIGAVVFGRSSAGRRAAVSRGADSEDR
jgi:MFS family permease